MTSVPGPMSGILNVTGAADAQRLPTVSAQSQQLAQCQSAKSTLHTVSAQSQHATLCQSANPTLDTVSAQSQRVHGDVNA
eukprot:696608-Rhodomonas_salina.1